MKPVYLKTPETRMAGAERRLRFLERRSQLPETHPDYDPGDGGGGGGGDATFGLYGGSGYMSGSVGGRALLWEQRTRGNTGTVSPAGGGEQRIPFDDTGIFEIYATAEVGNTAAIDTKTAYLLLLEQVTTDGSTWTTPGDYIGAQYRSNVGIPFPATGAIDLITSGVAIFDNPAWVNSGVIVYLNENETGDPLAVNYSGLFVRKVSN